MHRETHYVTTDHEQVLGTAGLSIKVTGKCMFGKDNTKRGDQGLISLFCLRFAFSSCCVVAPSSPSPGANCTVLGAVQIPNIKTAPAPKS